MKITLRRAHDLARNGKLRGVHILPSLYESEGIQGSRFVRSVGHPLQHVAVLTAPAGDKSLTDRSRAMVSTTEQYGGLAMLEDAYHQRGPGNAGPKAHSQFKTDTEAAEKVADALSSRGGIRALELLKSCPHLTIKLTAYVGNSFDIHKRTAQIIDQTDPTSVKNFVWLQTTSTDLVVVFLHPRGSLLHIQSCYPANPDAMSARWHWELQVTEHLGNGNRTNHPATYG